MLPKFKELDRDGPTARLWETLRSGYAAALIEAGLMPAGAESTQPGDGEGAGGAGGEKEISALEKTTPPLDRDSGKWVNNKRAAEIEGVETRTLADYRTQGIKNAAGTLGRDKDGRVWRREGTPNAHPWYLRSTLRAASK
jgi:hypothetical protein